MGNKTPLTLQEFIKKKYGNKFVDVKKVNKEFIENQKKLRKYWVLKNTGKDSEAHFLKRNLIY